MKKPVEAVVTAAEMGVFERQAMAASPGHMLLMEAAGWQVARLVRQSFRPQSTVILCGPGNNGGDGFTAARYLRRWGWPVKLALLGELSALRGDAAFMASRWRGDVGKMHPDLLRDRPLVIDALFGAGLSRPLTGLAAEMVDAARFCRVVAIDLPSGIASDSGVAPGAAMQAELTVTFAALKPGHLLLPGRLHCGRVVVTEIGVPIHEGACWHNQPALWIGRMPRLFPADNKYQRGHLLVAGGARLTGAARLAVWAGRRMGAGVATLAAPAGCEEQYRQDHPGTMVAPLSDWPALLADPRINAAVIGPGLGIGEATRQLILQSLAAGKACVIDADGLSSFAGDASPLWQAMGKAVLTPHDGEYARLFHFSGDRLTRARLAAQQSGAVVLLKGADTVVAAPDGRAAIASNAPPSLATAGAGDVLAGMIGGLLAQGMEIFAAACASVWLHGECARKFGAALVAEDLIDCLPSVLADLWKDHG